MANHRLPPWTWIKGHSQVFPWQDLATISKAAMKFKLSVKEKDKLLSEEQKRLLGGDLYTMTLYLAKGEEYSLGTCPGWSKKAIFRWQKEAGPREERGKHWRYFFLVSERYICI
jgi:hypothetical protein